MNTMVSNFENNSKPISAPQLTGVLKAIVPRSFEKTFEGIGTEQIAAAIRICIDGLSREQVANGLNRVRDNGFCPDPAMFRKWCLGIVGFGTEQQRTLDSFKGKHAALANIINWLTDNNNRITNAEKEAYNRCYNMFNAIDWANNVDRATYLAYEAFKDSYVEVVKEFAENGTTQAPWESCTSLESGLVVNDLYRPAESAYTVEQSPEQKNWIKQKTDELQATGLSFPMAMLEAMKLQRMGGEA